MFEQTNKNRKKKQKNNYKNICKCGVEDKVQQQI